MDQDSALPSYVGFILRLDSSMAPKVVAVIPCLIPTLHLEKELSGMDYPSLTNYGQEVVRKAVILQS